VTALAMTSRLAPQFEERRRHARVDVRLPGQFMRENRQEFPCATIDIAPGGIAFAAEAAVSHGEKIIAYLAQIGRVQGVVRRQFPGGFAISMTLPPMKREKLADQLTWLANRQALGMPEDRRHERIAPRIPHSTLTLSNGREILCKIVDISRSGASVALASPPSAGMAVTLGKTRGQVVREFTGGIAIEFQRIIAEDLFDEDYIP
jgi:c-di-GMP-binding flagellar brake protein YcgR